jgi:hypothetical protein
MTQEIAILPFRHPVQSARLQGLVLDLTNPAISNNVTVLSKRTESPDERRGVWFQVSVMVPVGDVPTVSSMIGGLEKSWNT